MAGPPAPTAGSVLGRGARLLGGRQGGGAAGPGGAEDHADDIAVAPDAEGIRRTGERHRSAVEADSVVAGNRCSAQIESDAAAAVETGNELAQVGRDHGLTVARH